VNFMPRAGVQPLMCSGSSTMPMDGTTRQGWGGGEGGHRPPVDNPARARLARPPITGRVFAIGSGSGQGGGRNIRPAEDSADSDEGRDHAGECDRAARFRMKTAQNEEAVDLAPLVEPIRDRVRNWSGAGSRERSQHRPAYRGRRCRWRVSSQRHSWKRARERQCQGNPPVGRISCERKKEQTRCFPCSSSQRSVTGPGWRARKAGERTDGEPEGRAARGPPGRGR